MHQSSILSVIEKEITLYIAMKEFIVTFNLLANDYEQAQKLSEPICTYFLKDNMCTLESVRAKNPETSQKNTNSRRKTDKSWLDGFGYPGK